MTTLMHDVDSGHAWLILFAASTLFFLCEGFRKSLSVLLPTLKDQFETHTWLIGIMLALTHGVKDFLGKVNVKCSATRQLKKPLIRSNSALSCLTLMLPGAVARFSFPHFKMLYFTLLKVIILRNFCHRPDMYVSQMFFRIFTVENKFYSLFSFFFYRFYEYDVKVTSQVRPSSSSSSFSSFFLFSSFFKLNHFNFSTLCRYTC